MFSKNMQTIVELPDFEELTKNIQLTSLTPDPIQLELTI
jgi:hypothetical protein